MTTLPVGAERRLTGTLTVALPPAATFGLFTPHGEQRWAPGWAPRFPAERSDDSHPGTVFETDDSRGRTVTWIVLEREHGRRIRYARTTPQITAGTVAVSLEPDTSGTRTRTGTGTLVTVTYELTALSQEGRSELAAFADGYETFLRSWQDAIAQSSPDTSQP